MELAGRAHSPAVSVKDIIENKTTLEVCAAGAAGAVDICSTGPCNLQHRGRLYKAAAWP